MKILALDTSAENSGLALLEGESLQALSRIRLVRSHSRPLWRVLHFLLGEAGWRLEDLEGYVVSSGPGSFTGIRIGLATVKALALVSGKPVAAVSVLEILAAAWIESPALIVPVLDARKKEVYYAGFRSTSDGGLQPALPAGHGRPEELADQIREPALLSGSGAWLYRSVFRERLGPLADIPPWPYHQPSMLIQGALGLERIRAGETVSPHELRPLYVRPADAELARPAIPAGREGYAGTFSHCTKPEGHAV